MIRVVCLLLLAYRQESHQRPKNSLHNTKHCEVLGRNSFEPLPPLNSVPDLTTILFSMIHHHSQRKILQSLSLFLNFYSPCIQWIRCTDAFWGLLAAAYAQFPPFQNQTTKYKLCPSTCTHLHSYFPEIHLSTKGLSVFPSL